eukprot:scaffold6226_cov117-Isochrysis_galbana.AAC.3
MCGRIADTRRRHKRMLRKRACFASRSGRLHQSISTVRSQKLRRSDERPSALQLCPKIAEAAATEVIGVAEPELCGEAGVASRVWQLNGSQSRIPLGEARTIGSSLNQNKSCRIMMTVPCRRAAASLLDSARAHSARSSTA